MQRVFGRVGSRNLDPCPYLSFRAVRRSDEGVRTPPSRAPILQKHPLQNTESDCHQWLSDSCRVHQNAFSIGAPPDLLAGLRGTLLLRQEEKWGRERRIGEGRPGSAPAVPGLYSALPSIPAYFRAELRHCCRVRTKRRSAMM